MHDKFSHFSNKPTYYNQPDTDQAMTFTCDDGRSAAPNSISDNTGAVALTYKCPHVEQLRSQQLRSEAVTTRSMLWRIMITTKLNRKSSLSDNDAESQSMSGDSSRFLSVYVQCDPEKESKFWHCYAKCRITLVSKNPAMTISKEFRNNFTKKDNDFGYSEFISFSQLMDSSNEFLEPLPTEEGCQITLLANVITEYPYGVDWDSRGNTNHVGLLNLGATCYMNSLLQTFYFTNQLRLATFNTPTYMDDGSNSIMYALQYIFYQLQFSKSAVDTTRLTQAFGWTQADSFQQHDVQEFCRILLESMENSMKGTAAENIIAKLLEGKQMSYIKCVNVDYQSERIESVYDIQLKVKGLRDVYESFDDYVQIEKLDGDNKYAAEGYGYQEADKGVIFTYLPPVLHLHLMRFTFDMDLLDFIKIKDRYEFPEELNLDKYLQQDHVNPDDPAIYTLAGVLVHIGGINSGHYVVYINPDCSGQWLKFDDDLVVKVNKNEAVDDNFGGCGVNVFKLGTTAYMLVYVRNSARDHIFKSIDCEDIPADLVRRITRDITKERFAQYKYEHKQQVVTLEVYLEDCLFVSQPVGLVDCSKQHSYCFEFFPTYTFAQALTYVCSQLKIQPESCRVWLFGDEPALSNGNNPGLPKFFPQEQYSSVLTHLAGFSKTIHIFLDTPTSYGAAVPLHSQYLTSDTKLSSQDANDQSPPAISQSNNTESNDNGVALIFIKFYDIYTRTVSYVGHIYVDPRLTWNHYSMPILQMCGTTQQSANNDDNSDTVTNHHSDINNGVWNVQMCDTSSMTFYVEETDEVPLLIMDLDGVISNYVTNGSSCILCVQRNIRHTAAITNSYSLLADAVDFPQFIDEYSNSVKVKFVDKKLPTSSRRSFTIGCRPSTSYNELLHIVTSHVVHPQKQIQLYYSTIGVAEELSNLQPLTSTNPLTVLNIARKSKSYMQSTTDGLCDHDCLIVYDCLDICVDELVENVCFHLKFIPDCHSQQTPAAAGHSENDLAVETPSNRFTSCFHLPLLLPRSSTIKELIHCANQYLRSIDYPLTNSVRILEVVSSKIVCILSDDIAVSRILPSIENTLLVEETPTDQLNLSLSSNPNVRLVNCCFSRNKNLKNFFGVPFLVKITRGMTYNDVVEQIKNRLQCYPSEFLNECSLFFFRLQQFHPFPQLTDDSHMKNEFPFEKMFPKRLDLDLDEYDNDDASGVFSSSSIIGVNMNTTDTTTFTPTPVRNYAALRIAK